MTFSTLKYYYRLIQEMKEKKKWYKGKIFQPLDTNGMKFPYNIKMKFEYLIYDIKSAWQRAKNGYSHADVWDFSDWFSNNIIHMLDDLINNQSGYPGTEDVDSPEKWDQILRYMKFCFQESREDTCSQQNKIKDPIFNMIENDDGTITFTKNDSFEQWSKRERELSEYRQKMKNEGLDLFKKYYYELWD